MRISHIYPITLVIVLAILGGVAYVHWHTGSSAVVPSAMTASSTTVETVGTTTPTTGQSASVAVPASASAQPSPQKPPEKAPGTYTPAEVATHGNVSSCWTSVNGNVYDVTAWISHHPGGSSAILSLCGHDGTSAFTAQHGGQRRPEQELASFKIGALAK